MTLIERILITGASGFVGGQLMRHLSGHCEVHGTWFSHRPPDSLDGTLHRCDITDGGVCHSLLQSIQPDWVIHAAAMTNSNECARNPATADVVNAKSAGLWASACHDRGISFLYLSTDLVFSGRSSWSREDLEPDPVCTYGRTKFCGEVLVRTVHPGAIIARSALQFGLSVTAAHSFTETLVENLRGSRTVRLFRDEFRTPLYSIDCCEIIRHLVFEEQHGIRFIHLAGKDRISRYQFGVLLCRRFGFDESLLIATNVADAQFIDERPRDCSMAIPTLTTHFPDLCRHIEAGLKLFFDEYNHRKPV